MKGNFIVLEGIDGCGKTTQINHLAQWLPKSGLMPENTTLHITREPGGTSLGQFLRELLLNPPYQNSPYPITEILLYAADRAQHVSELVMPTLEKGDWVLSDRFSGSTLAYQGFGRQLNIDLIQQLENIATQGIFPDITLWLDLPVDESISRRGGIPNDRIESEGAEFLRRVAKGFVHLAETRHWKRIPASGDRQHISHQIEQELLQYFQLNQT